MPPKGSSTKLAPPRLPPLPKLRVRRPNQPTANPCVGIMTSVLGISPAPYILFNKLEGFPTEICFFNAQVVGHRQATQQRAASSWSSS